MQESFRIREINPGSDAEVFLVAQRMRATLVEVLGAERGESLYSLEWLIARVRWHLDATQTSGKVFLLEGASSPGLKRTSACATTVTSLPSSSFPEPAGRG